MQFEGAVIKEQGIVFAVVVVPKHIIENVIEANKAVKSFSPVFPGMPVVLMGQDRRGRPSYFGRRDIAKFLSRVSLDRIPWRRYSL